MGEGGVCCRGGDCRHTGPGSRPLSSGMSQYELVVLHLDTAVCVCVGETCIFGGQHYQLVKGAWNFFLRLCDFSTGLKLDKK